MARFLNLHVAIARILQLGSCACLMGCAVTSPLATTQINGTRVAAVSEVDFPEPEAEQTEASQLRMALVQELGRRDISVTSDANMLAQMSYSASPSSIGIYANQSDNSDSEAVPMTDTRTSRWYDRCKTVRVRASLALFEKDSGELRSSSTVQATICDGDTADHDEVAQQLIDNVLAR